MGVRHLTRSLALAAAASCYVAASVPAMPSIRVVGAKPALAGSYNRVVATEAELRQAIADIGTLLPQGAVIGVSADINLGNTNRATGGFTDKTLWIIDKSCTIEPATGYGTFDANPMGDGIYYGQRFTRSITLKGFITATASSTRRTVIIRGFNRTVDAFPTLGDQTTMQTWWDIGCAYRGDGSVEASSQPFAIDTFNGNVNFKYSANRTYMGADINHTPFNPYERPVDSYSPTSWQFRTDGGINVAGGTNTSGTVYSGHGHTNWVRYNRIISGPRGLMVDDWRGDSGEIDYNYLHDLMTGYKLYSVGGGSYRQNVLVHHNEFDRNYTDHVQESQDAASKPVIKRWANFRGRGIGNSRDNANPHGDDDQYFMNAAAGATLRVVAHHRVWNEVLWGDKDDLRSSQGLYFQGGTPNYQQLGWEVHNSIILNRIKFFSMMSGANTLIRNCIAVNQDSPRANDPNAPGSGQIQMERNNDNNSTLLRDSLSLIENVIHEGFYVAAGPKFVRQFVRSNFKDMGNPQTGAHAALAAAEFLDLERSIQTPNDAFLAAMEKAGGGSNIGVGYATLADLIDGPEPDYPFLGFPRLVNLDPNVQYEMDAYVHGIEGTARAITAISSGLEAKAIDAYSSADITAYSTGNFTTHAGEVVRVRFTTPNVEYTETRKTITHNGTAVDVIYLTKQTSLNPLVDFNSANLSKASGIGAVDTTKMSMFFDFVFTQNNATQMAFVQGSGTNISCSFTSAEALTLLCRLSAVTQASFTLLSSTFVNGQRYRIHVMVDTSLNTVQEAVRVWVNDLEVQIFSAQAYTKNGTLKFGLSNNWNLFNNSAGTQPFVGNLGSLVIWPGVAYDWSDFSLRRKTLPSLIGTDGSGIDGTPAKIFIRGDATKINGASTANDGTGGAFDNIGTDVI